MKRINPWYRGFRGSITLNEEQTSFVVEGRYEIINKDTLVISELPLRKWTRDYKTFLEELAKEDLIDDIKEFHKDDKVKFVLKVPTLSKIDDIPKKFKLTSSLSCSNYVLFSAKGQIKKYQNEL
jgi:DNA topoisomerase II